MNFLCPRVGGYPINRNLNARSLVAILAISTGIAAHAHTYCVSEGDVAGLKAALAEASNNGESDVIQLQAGHYSMPANFVLDYEQSATDQGDLSIEGGFGPNIGGPCGTTPSVPDATVTVLDGGSWRARLADGTGSLTLTALTINGAFGTDPIHPPVELMANTNSTGTISVENTIFENNASTAAAALYVVSGEGALVVRNSLFVSNVSSSATSGPIVLGSTRIGSLCALVANSTFVNNNSTQRSVEIATPDCPALLANDIFWHNTPGGSLAFDNAQTVIFSTSELEDLAEASGTGASNLVSIDPLFNVDYSLSDFSPLRDKGSAGAPFFSPGDFDVEGQPRIYHSEHVDIGAFEVQDVIFAHDFDFQMPF